MQWTSDLIVSIDGSLIPNRCWRIRPVFFLSDSNPSVGDGCVCSTRVCASSLPSADCEWLIHTFRSDISINFNYSDASQSPGQSSMSHGTDSVAFHHLHVTFSTHHSQFHIRRNAMWPCWQAWAIEATFDTVRCSRQKQVDKQQGASDPTVSKDNLDKNQINYMHFFLKLQHSVVCKVCIQKIPTFTHFIYSHRRASPIRIKMYTFCALNETHGQSVVMHHYILA